VRRGSDVNWHPVTRARARIVRWAVGLASVAIAVGALGLGLRTPKEERGNPASPDAMQTVGSAQQAAPLRILNPGAAEGRRTGERRVPRQDAAVGYESPPPRMQPPPRRGPADY